MIVRFAAARRVPTASARAALLRNAAAAAASPTPGRGALHCRFATITGDYSDDAKAAGCSQFFVPRATVAAPQPELALAFDYVDDEEGHDGCDGPKRRHRHLRCFVGGKTPGGRPGSSPYPPPPPPGGATVPPASLTRNKATGGGGGGGGPPGGGGGRNRCPKVHYSFLLGPCFLFDCMPLHFLE